MHRVDPPRGTLTIDFFSAPYRSPHFSPPGEPTSVHQTDQEEELYPA
jgi:hypothetical protein